LRGDAAAIPFAGRRTGKTKVAECFRIISETTGVLAWDPRHYVASGDRVAVFGSMDVRAKVTGQKVAGTDWALDFTARSGRVTGWQVYVDTAAMEKAYRTAAKASG